MTDKRKFSFTSMASWRRCRAQYKWKYIDNLAPVEGTGRVRGSCGHKSLAAWYLNGCDEEADAIAMKVAYDFFNEFERVNNCHLDKEWDLMQVILPRYFDWARANDDFSEILAIEQEFSIPIGDHTFIGFIDGIVVTKQGSIWLLEHKFNKQVSFKTIDLDKQMSMYLLAAQKMGINARGVLYNVIRVAEGGIAERQPVERRQVYRRPDGLRLIEAESILQMDEMQEFHDKGGRVYRNETGNCSWDCSFFSACLAMTDDGDAKNALASIPVSERERKEKDLGDEVE